VHGAAVDPFELGHPAADVRTVRIEPSCLAGRVEDAIRPRVGPRPGDPLPVPDVVRHVAVDEVLREVRGPETPVQIQVLHEERRRDQPCAVRHRPFRKELPHPGIDERIAGSPRLPSSECRRILAPEILSRVEILARDTRLGGEQLVVEVAPAELPPERFAGGLLP
jgi:hypothetical protein